MINVLVVDDSASAREFLVRLLDSDPELQVIGTAKNGVEAIDFLKEKKPDIITMDLHMPEMDGFETTRKIMETHPTPVVIVSGSSVSREVAVSFRALDAGALAMLERPPGANHPDHERSARELIQTVKLMSEVKVVRRWRRMREDAAAGGASVRPQTRKAQLVAIGASTGGPQAIQVILSGLPENFSAPLLIVQHISRGFLDGFVEWLNQSSRVRTSLARHGEKPEPGRAYIAPDGLQMKLDTGGAIKLLKDLPVNGHIPSVSYLFASVAQVMGPNAAGVLLTGMGIDGADGLKAMRDAGSITIAQDQESSVVYGMPGKAVRIGAAVHVLPAEAIAATLIELTGKGE